MRLLRRVEHHRRGSRCRAAARLRPHRGEPRARPSRSKGSPARPRRRRASRPACRSSIASRRRASCRARCCSLRASPASANRRSCCSSRPRWRAPAGAPSISRARRPWRRCGSAPRGSGSTDAAVALAAETSLANILATLAEREARRPRRHRFHPDAVVGRARGGAGHREPGSRRDAIARALRQKAGSALLLVGHVTKDGQIAGPKVDRAHGRYRALVRGRPRPHVPHSAGRPRTASAPPTRSASSRWRGPASRRSPTRPSCSSATATRTAPGSAVFAGMEGTRPILVEIQALVAPSGLGVPRRAVVGWEPSRLAMLIAVLEARCGVSFAHHDVYLNVAGGLRIVEPAADLGRRGRPPGVVVQHRAAGTTASISARFRFRAPSAPARTWDFASRRPKSSGFAQAVIPAAGESGADAGRLELDAHKPPQGACGRRSRSCD